MDEQKTRIEKERPEGRPFIFFTASFRRKPESSDFRTPACAGVAGPENGACGLSSLIQVHQHVLQDAAGEVVVDLVQGIDAAQQ